MTSKTTQGNSDASYPRGGSMRPHMRPNRHRPALVWPFLAGLFQHCAPCFLWKRILFKTGPIPPSLKSGSGTLLSFFFLFADVTSELSLYWRTPCLSGMDTIYGPAQVTASDLVKNEDSLCRGGSKSRGTEMSFLINLLCGSKSMLFS